jgi:hypothetical protein
MAAPSINSTLLMPLRADIEPLEGSVLSEAQEASKALVSSLSDLSRGCVKTAAECCEGSYVEPGGNAPDGDETTAESRWQLICQQYLCLPITRISEVQKTAPETTTFEVIFTWPDGQLLEIGACCCGNPAASPPVWQFAYPVAFKDSAWKVMRGPLYVP